MPCSQAYCYKNWRKTDTRSNIPRWTDLFYQSSRAKKWRHFYLDWRFNAGEMKRTLYLVHPLYIYIHWKTIYWSLESENELWFCPSYIVILFLNSGFDPLDAQALHQMSQGPFSGGLAWIFTSMQSDQHCLQEHAAVLLILTHSVTGRTQRSYWKAYCLVWFTTNRIWTTEYSLCQYQI